ncbi:MAG: hypothetical protein WCP55_02910, partial [Lentisphaerota bacterium]
RDMASRCRRGSARPPAGAVFDFSIRHRCAEIIFRLDGGSYLVAKFYRLLRRLYNHLIFRLLIFLDPETPVSAQVLYGYAVNAERGRIP